MFRIHKFRLIILITLILLPIIYLLTTSNHLSNVINDNNFYNTLNKIQNNQNNHNNKIKNKNSGKIIDIKTLDIPYPNDPTILLDSIDKSTKPEITTENTDNNSEDNSENSIIINQSFNPLINTTLDNSLNTTTELPPILPKNYNGPINPNFYSQFEQKRLLNNFKNYELENDLIIRQNATILSLARNEELYDMLSSIQQVEDRFNNKFHYDWVFLNDKPFTDEFIKLTSSLCSGITRYGIIPYDHWSYPDFINQDTAKKIREMKKFQNIPYWKSESYRHMCRFNSGFFYKHPILNDYQYYWRVEPNVIFNCNIINDPFKFMIDNNKLYGFTISMLEFSKTIPNLFKLTKEFFLKNDLIKKNYLPNINDSLLNFITDISKFNNYDEIDIDKLNYNLCHFWSNFEIANLDLFRNELYESFFQYLDKSGGFFYERWGDAPVHTLAVAFMLRKDQVHIFQDISYRHTVAGTCPLDDQQLVDLKCSCNPELDWAWNSASSCNPLFVNVSNSEKPKDYDKYMKIKIENEKEQERLRLINVEIKRKEARARAEMRKQQAEERRKKKEVFKQQIKEQRLNNGRAKKNDQQNENNENVQNEK
ncbi:hypothetical protein B5S32_g4615 [[Candida] boidinii]|nr:hypothetical protein B5S32_g4615 [[Candida] boidinii]